MSNEEQSVLGFYRRTFWNWLFPNEKTRIINYLTKNADRIEKLTKDAEEKELKYNSSVKKERTAIGKRIVAEENVKKAKKAYELDPLSEQKKADYDKKQRILQQAKQAEIEATNEKIKAGDEYAMVNHEKKKRMQL